MLETLRRVLQRPGPGRSVADPANQLRSKRRGEPWRTRTSDPLIKSQLLYQLS